MKYCVHCGHELSDEALFCDNCGASVTTQQAAPVGNGLDTEKQYLDTFYRFFKYERLSWKIGGVVFLILSLFFLGFALLFLTIALARDAEEVAMVAPLFILYGLVFLPVAIVNLKMVKKTEYYMNTLYMDVRPTIERSGSVGMIVLSAFFNEIAMIFIIINFVRTKNNKALLQQIAYRQQNPPM